MPNPVEVVKRAAVEAVEAQKPVYLLFGQVISTSPLKIQVDQKSIYTEKMLVLTRNVTDFEVDMTVNHQTCESSHSHKVSGTALSASHFHSVSGNAIPAEHGHTVTALTDDGHQVDGEANPVSHEHGVVGTAQSTSHDHDLDGLALATGHSHNYRGKKKFKVHNALIKGDWVLLGRIQGGKRFVVIDRIKPIPELKGEWL